MGSMAQYALGIDLGTTNCVLAFTSLADEEGQPQIFEVPQCISPGNVAAAPQLPSFLYLPPEAEADAFELPWSNSGPGVAGQAAQRISSEQPDRVVVAAKSWLCHARVNRQEPILPWSAPESVTKVSPVSASRRFLEHLVAAWNHAHPDAPFAEQRVVLTVPASFDPAARELTREAAVAAGLPEDFTMLEEPQAAVYRWLAALGEEWRKELKQGDSILVVDVGGGTTDLTLVVADDDAGNLVLRRVAVGNHLLVGGDNMDLSLAHVVSQQLAAEGHRLNPWQSTSLWHMCRSAKEALLDPSGPEVQTIAVLGRGSRLIGGTLTTELQRSTVADTIVEGFFPLVPVDARPAASHASGFQDIGLPYESDPAISRHIAAFLADHHAAAGSTYPTHLLLNGGVFRAAALRQRVMQMLSSWSESEPSTLLGGPTDLDHAVALGAAYYGWSKDRGGVRIRGGTPRSYYVGIETAGLAIPGAPRPLRAVCVAPQGMEEGSEADVPHREVGLIVGQPASFRFFSSTTRREDQPGDTLDYWTEDELVENPPVEVTLPSVDVTDQQPVPVRFHSRVTELGMFELWCHSTRDDHRWKLEFNTREEEA